MPLVVRGLFVCEFLLGIAHLLDVWAGHPSWTLTQLVNLDGEANLPAWFSSIQLFLLALLLAAVAGPLTTWRDHGSWPVLALATLALALSCDEVAQLHEWLGNRSDALLPGGVRSGLVRGTGVWMFLLVPPFALAVLFLWRAFRRALAHHPEIERRYRLGFVCYVLAIAGLELIGNAVRNRPVWMMTEVLFEEIGEMAAVTLLVWATLDLLAARGVRLSFAGFPPR